MATKKSPLKKTTAKQATHKKTKQSEKFKSFQLSRDYPPFMTFRVTKQTIYWSALLIFILIVQIWILNVQLDVISTLDALNNL